MRLLRLRDLFSLTKPHIALTSMLVAGGGMTLASSMAPVPGATELALALASLFGIGLLVGGAGSLNMYFEREADRLMHRTRQRPLPSERLAPSVALLLGLVMSALALGLLFYGANLLTCVLGAAGLIIYILVYTPLKRHTPLALLAGSAAGALPPLMGWTAITGDIGPAALMLYGTLFIWQVPHFVAISLYRSADYARAGFRTIALARGRRVARSWIVLPSALLIPVSLLVWLLGHAGWIYGAMVLVSGCALLLVGVVGHADLSRPSEMSPSFWARRYFGASLIYLPALALGLMLDRWLLG